MARYRVIIGDEFAVEGVEIEDAEAVVKMALIDVERRRIRVQERVTFAFLGAFFAALVVSGVKGLWDGSFHELNIVWSTGAVWLGYVFATYFKKEKG